MERSGGGCTKETPQTCSSQNPAAPLRVREAPPQRAGGGNLLESEPQLPFAFLPPLNLQSGLAHSRLSADLWPADRVPRPPQQGGFLQLLPSSCELSFIREPAGP